MNKVYVVECGYYSGKSISAIFSTEEQAKRYCDIKNELTERADEYYYNEYELDKDIYSPNTKVVSYYCCSLYLEDVWDWNHEKVLYPKGSCTTNNTVVKRVYTEDTILNYSTNKVILTVYSTKGFNYAYKIAQDEYYKYQAEKEGIM